MAHTCSQESNRFWLNMLFSLVIMWRQLGTSLTDLAMTFKQQSYLGNFSLRTIYYILVSHTQYTKMSPWVRYNKICKTSVFLWSLIMWCDIFAVVARLRKEKYNHLQLLKSWLLSHCNRKSPDRNNHLSATMHCLSFSFWFYTTESSRNTFRKPVICDFVRFVPCGNGRSIKVLDHPLKKIIMSWW